jgi:hypothetical protein
MPMKTLMLTLAAAACVGLALPAFATDKMSSGQSSPQLISADDLSAAKKKAAVKKKKKSGTSGGGGGGMWGG